MKTKEDEFFSKNAELSIEFSKYVLEHPEIDDILDEEAIIIFLPEFDLPLKKYNAKIAKELAQEGKNVISVTLQKMRRRPISRLEGVKINQPGRMTDVHSSLSVDPRLVKDASQMPVLAGM